MAKTFDRRSLLCAGCSAFAAACGPRDIVAFPTGVTGDTAGGPPPIVPSEGYPCDQTIDPGGPGWFGLSLAEYPDLAQVGGWYGVSVGGENLVVAHAIDGCYAAIRRACAHEGVAIVYSPSRAQFTCPAHGAVYDLQGDKVAGPQPTGLPVFPCGRDGDTIWVKV
ncbi:MAG: Rieske (2Fe-2S) protein [Myxococcota bacterium]